MSEGFGGLDFKDVTNMHPLGLAAVVVLGVAMLVLPRRWAILPMFIMACFIPSSQKISIMALDFSVLRIMVIFGWVRVWLKGETRGFVWRPLDKAIILWAVVGAAVHTLQMGNTSTLIYRLGTCFDALGTYFVFRCLIRDWTDVDRLILGCAIVSIPVAAIFLIENATGRNMFSIFGGVGEFTPIRYGRMRCQGAIGNSILAGCFWAGLLPLFAASWWKTGTGKLRAVVGVTTSLIIVVTCASSTPVLGVVAGVVGGLMFFCRRNMRLIRWGVLFTLVGLHIVMKAPVWNLVARVSAVGGSTGWFRYRLIDSAIRRFREWFLLGTRSTAHWFWGAQDLANHYIWEGVRGGFVTLALFVAVIVLGFKGVGRLWRANTADRYGLALSWAVGVSLFIHCAQFIGVSYYGGAILFVWYLPLAIIGSLSPTTAAVKESLVAAPETSTASYVAGSY